MSNKCKIDDVVDNISTDCLKDGIIDLLNLEVQINEKKKNNEKLTTSENFFDTYFVKPSFVLRYISRKVGKK